MKKYIYAIILLAYTSIFCGCKDFLEQYSQTLVVANDVSHFDELLIGDVYLKNEVQEVGPSMFSTGGFFNVLDDDINTSKGKGLPRQTAIAWSKVLNPMFGYICWQLDLGRNYNSTNTVNDNGTWVELYSKIEKVNVILSEIDKVPRNEDKQKSDYYRIVAESHFLRAHYYFVLANVYGDAYSPTTSKTTLSVPLKLTHYVEHDKEKKTQFSRATNEEVYSQIVKDLETSIENFEKVDPQFNSKRMHRASKTVAHLLLSRVYLYMQEWEKAEHQATKAIEDNRYSITQIGNLSSEKIFLSDENPEVIFSHGSNHLASTAILSASGGDLCVSFDLYKCFDVTKDKRAEYFGFNQSTDSISLGQKYIRSRTKLSRVSDVFTFRISEAYLNRAEACSMQQGKESIANDDIYHIRKNRIEGYVKQQFIGQELIDQVRLERRRELCFEGHRWFDLRRYAVNEKYPFEKEIVRDFNVADDEVDYVLTKRFVLKKKDYAYTFPIPKETLEFDEVPMEQNMREKREAIDVPKENTGSNQGSEDDETTTP